MVAEEANAGGLGGCSWWSTSRVSLQRTSWTVAWTARGLVWAQPELEAAVPTAVIPSWDTADKSFARLESEPGAVRPERDELMCDENSKAEKSYLLHLGAHSRAPKAARIALKKNLEYWGLSHLLADAELVATELATNAMKRGRPFTLELTKGENSVLIAVSDSSDGMPVVIDNTENVDAEAGRGMYIVDLISKEWGVRLAEKGKTVWARIGA